MQPQLRELVRASNPVVDPDRLLVEERELLALYSKAMQRAGNPPTSADLLDRSVERRRDMQTQQRPGELVARGPRRPRRRWLVVAAAAAAVAVVIGAGTFLLSGSGVVDPPPVTQMPTTTVAPTTTVTSTIAPASLGTATALNDRAVSADWSGVAALFADSATLQFVEPDGPSAKTPISDPVPEEVGIVDWNDDGVVTQLDWFLQVGAEIYVGQATSVLACDAVDATTALCDEVREGFVFESAGYEVTWTLTVEDGLITALVFDVSASTADGSDPLEVGRYRIWVADNHPELVEGLFDSPVALHISPANVETHRELIAAWHEETVGS